MFDPRLEEDARKLRNLLAFFMNRRSGFDKNRYGMGEDKGFERYGLFGLQKEDFVDLAEGLVMYLPGSRAERVLNRAAIDLRESPDPKSLKLFEELRCGFAVLIARLPNKVVLNSSNWTIDFWLNLSKAFFCPEQLRPMPQTEEGLQEYEIFAEGIEAILEDPTHWVDYNEISIMARL